MLLQKKNLQFCKGRISMKQRMNYDGTYKYYNKIYLPLYVNINYISKLRRFARIFYIFFHKKW